MSGDFEIKDANGLLEAARKARLEMVIFHHDSQVPGEVASLARLFWRHIPEMARRAGAELSEKEGHPEGIVASDQSLIKMISSDMVDGRDTVNWLAKVTSAETKAMFAKGTANSLENFIQKFADERNITREDALAHEAGRSSMNSRTPEPQVAKARAFAFSQMARTHAF